MPAVFKQRNSVIREKSTIKPNYIDKIASMMNYDQ